LSAQEGWANAITPVKMPTTAMVQNVKKPLALIMSLPLEMKSNSNPEPGGIFGGSSTPSL
jgi:hypothetical protein